MPVWAAALIWLLVGLAVLALGAGIVVLVRTLRVKAPEIINEPMLTPDPEVCQHAAESLSQMVRFKTISYDNMETGGTSAEFLGLHAYLEKRYPGVHRTMQREKLGLSLIYRWPAQNPQGDPLLFCAHLDVVAAEGEWEHQPFSGDIADGYVFGRGSLDCKDIITGVMEATEALINEGFAPTRDIYFAFGQDEEISGTQGAVKIAELFKKHGIHFAMVLDEGGCVKKGAPGLKHMLATIDISEKGFLNFKLTAHTKGGHSSTPARHTAIGQLSEAVCRIEYRRRPAHLEPVVAERLTRMAPFMSFQRRMMIANLWLLKPLLLRSMAKDPKENSMIRSTIACTMAKGSSAPNILPETAEIICNCRPAHGDSCEKILHFIRELVRDLDIEVDSLRAADASKISDFRSPEFETLSTLITEMYKNVLVVPNISSGGTDSRKYEDLCDCVFRFGPFVLTPFDTSKVHASNESMRIESLGAGVLFYKELIRRMAQ